MLLKRLAFLASVLVIAPAACAQQTSTIAAPTVDPQAVSILQQSVSTMQSAIPSDSVASGTIQIVAGSSTNQGTIRISTKGTTESLVQITTPAQTTSVIYSNGQANEVTANAVNILPMELVVTSQSPEFPVPLLTALLNDPDTSFQYVGLETSNGLSLQHIRSWDSFASSPSLAALSPLSTRDIWIDASSGLVQRISFTRRAAQGASPGIAVDLFYSGYQTTSGVAYPFNIQESLNGTPWATITIQTVSFNTGLTDASFPIQQMGATP